MARDPHNPRSRDAEGSGGLAGDRAPVIIAMVPAALSGFVVGCLVSGEFLNLGIVACIVLLSGGLRWWLRGAL